MGNCRILRTTNLRRKQLERKKCSLYYCSFLENELGEEKLIE
uniref:Uncharacterized protein n=1 Tax=Meloidogyne enterolobii TaxID=390850 RepID=A0A6V7UZ65_MELEN|nr:unnamed protein product [Meloidogyne enterolobii]